MQKLLLTLLDEPTASEPEKTKKCSKCNQNLSADCFSPCSGGKYLRPECKECGYELSKTRKKLREENEKPSPDYVCPICLKNEEEVRGLGGKKSGSWVIDHHHKTKKFRGWLCHKCNRIFNDGCTKDLLLRAIEYLENK